MIENIGWLSAIFLTLCSFPQLIKTLKEGHCKGLSGLFLFFWMFGEWFGFAYVLPSEDYPLIVNYGVNSVFISIIAYYKIRPRNIDEQN